MSDAIVLDAEKVSTPIAKKSHGGARPNSGGARPGAGRKKGVPNKFNGEIKAAIVEAFEAAGGAAYLLTVAQTKPEVFCSLLGKVLPMQVTGDGGGPVVITWSNGS